MAINFILHETFLNVGERKRLKSYIESLFIRKEKKLSLLTYIFCSDQYLLSINREFLNHDDFTDIITFCLSEPTQPIIGEIYISADRIRENAQILGVSTRHELHRVIFHGALHLCGYKDKRPRDKARMTQEEDMNLALYFG
jgi:probable rRNA maturation factor